MFMVKWKQSGATLIVVGLALTSTGVLAGQPVQRNKKAQQETKAVQRVSAHNQKNKGKSIRQKKETKAYKRAIHNLMTLSPKQIKGIKSRAKRNEKASRGGSVPKSKFRSIRVVPGGSQKIKTIRIAPGYGSPVTILDATGQPWPITSDTIANGKAFVVKHPVKKGKGSSILTIVPQKRYAHSNMIITLKGLSTPINVRVKVTPKVNDSGTRLKIAARGPNASAPVSQASLAQPDKPIMRDLLNGVPPKSAKRLHAKGPGKVWLFKGHAYLRTKMTLISPAYRSVAHGSGGVRVYQVPLVATLELSGNQGRTSTLTMPHSALLDHALSGRDNHPTLGRQKYGPNSRDSLHRVNHRSSRSNSRNQKSTVARH